MTGLLLSPEPFPQTLLVLKGPVGIGKSTLSRALGKRLSWPIVDKDDYSDVLLRHLEPHGAASYDCMFSAVQSLLKQGFSVICDSPLRGEIGYQRARALAEEAQAALRILNCGLADEGRWRERIETRQRRPAHIIKTWADLLNYRQKAKGDFDYKIETQTLRLDMAAPLAKLTEEVVTWLGKTQELSLKEQHG